MSKNGKRMQDIPKNSNQTGEAGFRHLVLTLSPQYLIFLSSLSGNWYKQLSSLVVGQKEMSRNVQGGCGGYAGVYLKGVLVLGLLRLVSDNEIDLSSSDLLATSNLSVSQMTLPPSLHYLGIPLKHQMHQWDAGCVMPCPRPQSSHCPPWSWTLLSRSSISRKSLHQPWIHFDNVL